MPKASWDTAVSPSVSITASYSHIISRGANNRVTVKLIKFAVFNQAVITTLNYISIAGALGNGKPIRMESARGTILRNISLFGNSNTNRGLEVFVKVGDGVAPYSITIENSMFLNVTGSPGRGIDISDQTTWLADYCNFFGNDTDSIPALSDPNITNEITTDPAFGNVLIWVPSTSPNSGAGKAGADIGGNVIYKYVDGVLDTSPAGELWDKVTGQWKETGVQVAGVNDIAGKSLFDVHERLNVNFNGTMLPYASGAPQVNLSNPLSVAVTVNISGLTAAVAATDPPWSPSGVLWG